MGSFSFELKDHHHYLVKLNAEYADLENEPLSSRHAVNFAMTAYHMCEWVWHHEPSVNGNPTYSKPMDFYNAVNAACPAIPIMRDLTNGSKHAQITRGSPIVDGTELHEGTFDDTFDVTALLISMVDGSKRSFFREATEAMKFWRRLFLSGFKP